MSVIALTEKRVLPIHATSSPVDNVLLAAALRDHLWDLSLRPHDTQGATLLHIAHLDMQLEVYRSQTRYSSRCEEFTAVLGHLLSLLWHAHDQVPSSALLQLLLFGNGQTPENTRRRLVTNLRALVELKNLWPAAAMMESIMKSLSANTSPKTERFFTC